ncbi:MAG: ABC transporter ATP-binding protein, partial [Acidimicrobiales bacterium]
IDEPVKNYSSGMYVRLGFSVAINVDPEVLLVDEVLAVGDEAFQRKCSEKFAKLKDEGKTVVLVSHGMVQVHNLCDDVAWFENGRVKKVGSAKEIVDEYTGNVQIDREVDGDSGGTRWGSGDARIEHVELMDSADRVTDRVRCGDRVTLRLHYAMDEPIERPVFGFAIHTLSGMHVTGPNSRDVGMVPDKLEGAGLVEITFDPLRLLPGTYDLTVSLYDYSCLHAYDFRHRVMRFDVERGPIDEAYGVVSLGGSWVLGSLTSKE